MSDIKQYEQEEGIKKILDAMEIKSGVGDPASPLYGQLLTQEEEQKVDPSGELVVDGLPWSKAGSGLYLTIYVIKGHQASANKRVYGGCFTPVSLALNPQGLAVGVLTTVGKPTMSADGTGASLELPVDLAKDELKRKYVVEWIKDTTAESLALWGTDLSDKPGLYKQLGLTMAFMAEDAIRNTGL